MPRLILIKHSLPEINPSIPAHLWQLSFEGHLRCKPLAEKLAAYAPDIITTSTEIKAIQTALRVAENLDLPYEIVDNLHEHDRRNMAFESQDKFEARVADFFARPGELVFGLETADAAYQRFAQAVEGVIHQHVDSNVAIVAHGTVITLFLQQRTQLPTTPFLFWKKLGLPSFVVLSLPEFGLMDIAETVI